MIRRSLIAAALAAAAQVAGAQALTASDRAALSDLAGVWVGPTQETMILVCRPTKTETCHMATGDGELYPLKFIATDGEGNSSFTMLFPKGRWSKVPMTMGVRKPRGGAKQMTLNGSADLKFLRKPLPSDLAFIADLDDPCRHSQTAGTLRDCIEFEPKEATEQMEKAYKLAATRFMLNAAAMAQFNTMHIEENTRRENICGGQLAPLLEQDEPDVEEVYCHARMLRARAKALTRLAAGR